MHRIQKILSIMGVFSRRECEKLLLRNKIKINNKNAAIGSKVDINDVITVNNKKYIVTEDLFKLEIKAIEKVNNNKDIIEGNFEEVQRDKNDKDN